MSFLLAPYNNAMRLGMGFNSFTQQLCVNGAVKTDGNTIATEKDLRPVYKAGVMESAEGLPSQVVTYTAKFVDRISEVTDSMNVSGSLEIKCDAIAGGGGAKANFLDSNKFKESDLNYFIQVRVTNQQLNAPSVTEFCPIPNVPASEFTRVYGDSFVSGFLEGGEFNALISIKLKDSSKAKELGGKLQIALDLKAASVKGEAEGGKKSLESSYDGETTIAVSWSGGGDIKDETVTDWTFDSLKKVAMEFPEHVMACPLRTNAILTKYISLRSFYEKQVTASPLDYENAGVYSSALLDAYMDYKIIWRNVQTAAWEVEQGLSTLVAKGETPEFADLAQEADAYYKAQLQHYQETLAEPQETDSSSGAELVENPNHDHSVVPAHVSSHKRQLDPPMPPNALVPYKPSIFGLDKARRDCRFEMIKIVKEVDSVAENPKVATDPTRTLQYLSPAIFKMLLPKVLNKEAQKALEQQSQGAKLAAEAQTQVQDELSTTKAELQKTAEELRSVKTALVETEGKLRTSTEGSNSTSEGKLKAEEQLRAVQSSLVQTEEKLRASTEACNAIREDKLKVEERLLPSNGSRVWISAVIWGQTLISDPNVFEKCRQIALNRQSLPFGNSFFGCDPMPGRVKAGTIAYRYDDKGPIRYLTAMEGTSPRFDDLP